jgi:hypothetical protein
MASAIARPILAVRLKKGIALPSFAAFRLTLSDTGNSVNEACTAWQPIHPRVKR